jgi:hypothetical protein
MLVQYLKKGRTGGQGHRRGIMVAIKEGDEVKVGWSKCHRTDKFDPAEARSYAIARIAKPDGIAFPANESDRRQCNQFRDRMSRYYKVPVEKVTVA